MKFKDFIEFIKLPPNILAAIALVSGIIILSPDKLIKKLYMINFRNNYGFVISLIFLVSISILIVLFLTTIYKKIKEKMENKRLKKSQKKYLLSADEMKLKTIKAFIKNDTHTLKLNQNDGLTQELSYFGIISLAGNTQALDFGYNNEMYFSYFLQPWVINIINEDDELIKKYL